VDLKNNLKNITDNIEKLEKLIDEMNDGLSSKTKKIELLRSEIETNIKEIDKIIEEEDANSQN
tara:strand:- start:39 stop:227 length:189 start_codon:yes stop_codon:yes gene_type:complete